MTAREAFLKANDGDYIVLDDGEYQAKIMKLSKTTIDISNVENFDFWYAVSDQWEVLTEDQMKKANILLGHL